MQAAVLVEDMEAARVAHGAIGRLFGVKWFTVDELIARIDSARP